MWVCETASVNIEALCGECVAGVRWSKCRRLRWGIQCVYIGPFLRNGNVAPIMQEEGNWQRVNSHLMNKVLSLV